MSNIKNQEKIADRELCITDNTEYNNTMILNTKYLIQKSRSERPASLPSSTASSTPALAGESKRSYSDVCGQIENQKIMAAKSVLKNPADIFRLDVSLRSTGQPELIQGKRLSANLQILPQAGGKYLNLTCNLVPTDRLRELTHNAGKHTAFYTEISDTARQIAKLPGVATVHTGKIKLRQDNRFKHRKLIVPKMAMFLITHTAQAPDILIQIGTEQFQMGTYANHNQYSEVFPVRAHWQNTDSEEYMEIDDE